MPIAPGRIRLLADDLINQIAAGEIIERPASVVKELVENSLDAGAKRIEVEIEGGGVRLIRVRDDGCGIAPEDLALALRRHATSKLQSVEDLYAITSLGFRGEALPSIGAVSRLTLASRTAGSDLGWALEMEGAAHLSDARPTAHPHGTSVIVRDLMFNTPARRKFLRRERTEFLHLHELLKRIAISRRDVAFRLLNNGRTVLNLRAAEAQGEARVQELAGDRFMRRAAAFDLASNGLRAWGWAALPQAGDIQYLYVNGRILRDRTVNHAIRRAYEDTQPPGAEPAFIVFLEMEAGAVDVNVHPAKYEVRFGQPRLIHDFVYSAVKDALTGPGSERSRLSDSAAHGLEPTPRVNQTRLTYAQARSPKAGPDPLGAPLGRAIALLRQRYLLAENALGLVVVDAESALRRLIASRIRSAPPCDPVCSQPLLIPQPVSVSPAEAERVLGHMRILERLGLELDRGGPHTIILRRIPALLRGCDGERLIRDVAGVLSKPGGPEAALEQALCEILAKHGAILALASRTLDRWDGLLREVESLGLGHPGAARGLWRQLSVEDLSSLISGGLRQPEQRPVE
ncbi:MAG: DNA mismatch repair endonuclease MutL [Gammaproteobacteria bacterium]